MFQKMKNDVMPASNPEGVAKYANFTYRLILIL